MEACPQKIRELVLGAYENGDETAEIAEEFKVSPSWSRRVKQRLRECGSREAIQQKHGFDPKLGEREEKELAKFLAEKPDATLAELKKKLSKPVSISTICRTLQRMNLTLKKVAARQRARSGGREAEAAGLGGMSAGVGSEQACFLRRKRGQHVDGQNTRPITQREKAGRFSSRRALYNDDIDVGGSHGRRGGSHAAGWSCECRDVRRLCRRMLGARLGTGRHSDHGQSACPQERADYKSGRGCRMHTRLSAALFAGLESDRKHVVEGQGDPAKDRSAHVRGTARRSRRIAPCNHLRRLPRIFRALRVWRYIKLKRALGWLIPVTKGVIVSPSGLIIVILLARIFHTDFTCAL